MRVEAVDEFLIEQTDKAVQLAYDLFGMSQKWVERNLMILYLLICAAGVILLTIGHSRQSIGWDIFLDGFFFGQMRSYYKETKAQRYLRRTSLRLSRVSWVIILLCIFGINLLSGYSDRNVYIGVYAGLSTLWAVVPCLMMYVTLLDIEGKRRRSPKMSWEKFKELFGTSWMPKPVGDAA